MFVLPEHACVCCKCQATGCRQKRKVLNCVSLVDPPSGAGSGRGAVCCDHQTPNATHFKLLLTQAAWFLLHTCVSLQHKRGAQKSIDATVVERPAHVGLFFQNPANGVCNSERPACAAMTHAHTRVAQMHQGTGRHPKRRVLNCVSPINL